MDKTVYWSDTKEVERLLLGRRIVAAVENTLILDNGTELRLDPNRGCGACPSGNYYLDSLNTVDNIITSARVEVEDYSDEYDDGKLYTLYVVADNKELIVATIDGSDGNGWYGTGFEISVYIPNKH